MVIFEGKMIRFNDYLDEKLKKSPKWSKRFWVGYDNFKIGVILQAARIEAGLSQEEVAKRIKTTKSVISRIENHAEDMRLSTLDKFAQALHKEIHILVI